MTGVIVGFVGAVLATAIGRATGAGWLPAVGLAALLGVGLYLWARDEDKGWGDLGEGIVVSAIVAIALMGVQRDADERARETDQRRDDQLHAADVRRERQFREAEAARLKAAERQSLQLSLTMQTDLRGIVLAGRDLRDFNLAHKNFIGADLEDADLRGANLEGVKLRKANLVGAKFDNAIMSDADLRGATVQVLDPDVLADAVAGRDARKLRPASFRNAQLQRVNLLGATLDGVDFTGAHLTGANLRNMDFVDRAPSFQHAKLFFADFQGATLRGVDFRDATLTGARFCGGIRLRAARLRGAQADRHATRWPSGFDPTAHGVRRVRSLTDFDALVELSFRDSDAVSERLPKIRDPDVIVSNRRLTPYAACSR